MFRCGKHGGHTPVGIIQSPKTLSVVHRITYVVRYYTAMLKEGICSVIMG